MTKPSKNAIKLKKSGFFLLASYWLYPFLCLFVAFFLDFLQEPCIGLFEALSTNLALFVRIMLSLGMTYYCAYRYPTTKWLKIQMVLVPWQLLGVFASYNNYLPKIVEENGGFAASIELLVWTLSIGFFWVKILGFHRANYQYQKAKRSKLKVTPPLNPPDLPQELSAE